MVQAKTLRGSKKVPCEECRDQKRKCNGENPCERCHKFNLCCVYTSTRSPRDEEYIELARRAALVSQVEILNNQIKDMETMMKDMGNSNKIIDFVASPVNSIPSLMDDSDKSISSYEDSSVACVASIPPNVELKEIDNLIKPKPNKRMKLIASSGNHVHAYISTDTTDQDEAQAKAAPWTLTFKKGNMCINTNVKSHSDLLNNLYQMMGGIELEPQVPASISLAVKRNSIIGILNTLIRKKYGKTHCKNVARSVRIFVTPDLSNVSTMVVAQSPDSIQTTTMKLLRAYLRCQHLQQLAIHVRTFIRLYVDENSLENSPAAMALCAAICTLRCKHIADCLPSISLVEYGKFYFERARDLLSDLFDQFDLETLTSYTFMTIYKLTVSHTDEAMLYADMAERIALVLAPHYDAILKQKSNDNDDPSLLLRRGEAVHFSRLRNHLHRAQTFEQISRAGNPSLTPTAKDSLLLNKQDLPFCTLLHMGEGKWEIAEDDSVQEKWFAEMNGYILRLQRAEHEASRAAQSCDLHHLVGLIGHQVEMATRHWYYKVLPPEFRLSLPLYDSNIPCKEYYTTLERECSHSAIPVLTTLALYEEWIVLSQCYLPKRIPSPGTDWRLLNEVWRGGSTVDTTDQKWVRRVAKLMDLRKAIEFEGTDQEYLFAINSMLSPTETAVDTATITLALHSAFNTIRLVKFLRSRAADCYFDIRILINAWQYLLTISKLQSLMPAEILAFIPRIHKNLTTCMTIVQEELKLQPYQGKVGDYVAEMERDLKSQVINDDDDCDCVACPNA
ncbi:hypothetical protein HMPREF1544_08300 [Mucor circinelloides 1006PhL]|uniref:Zn(2)-C6 fungal-type domain-containing protein n=1 Tax=Mucor circinelloides f. circinelloides (strain 1006PhL) TaxID=1220926 RepID=S2J490_MUCC1|nr:hypothetical protein HMPREF1544_08300 [Mucor circinelloides 1006PhL]